MQQHRSERSGYQPESSGWYLRPVRFGGGLGGVQREMPGDGAEHSGHDPGGGRDGPDRCPSDGRHGNPAMQQHRSERSGYQPESSGGRLRPVRLGGGLGGVQWQLPNLIWAMDRCYFTEDEF